MPALLDTLCVLGSGLNEKWHSTDEFWNEAALNGILDDPPVRDSFFQANDFVKGADGLWHPRVEADQPVNSVWSQVTDFRAFFKREISTGVQQADRRHSAWENVPLLSGDRRARRTLLATQPSCPPGLETSYPAEEQRPSCVVFLDSADSGIFAAGALERERSPAVDGDVLLQVRGSHCPFREETFKFLNREPAHVIKCFFAQKTDR